MKHDAFESLRRRSLRAARGFTLIEIMLATAILGMVLLMLAGEEPYECRAVGEEKVLECLRDRRQP